MDAARPDTFFRRFARPAEPGLPKYAVLRRAIICAIAEGYWQPGAKLPTEIEFTRLTPFSLGTVQRGLRVLAEEGVISRRQGHGSFVAAAHQELEDPLHCRFLADDGVSYLPVFPRVLNRRRVARRGPWSGYLGSTAAFRIDRLINIGDEFAVFSSFYGDAERLRALFNLPLSALDSANFKLVVSRDLRLPVTRIEHHARVGPLPRHICDTLGIAADTAGLVLQIAARSGVATCLYYQELYIPPNRRTLEIRPAASTVSES